MPVPRQPFSDRSAPVMVSAPAERAEVCPSVYTRRRNPRRAGSRCLVLPERAMRRAIAELPLKLAQTPALKNVAAKLIPMKSRQFQLITNVLSHVAHVGTIF
jgi:hypothetical protein